MKQVQENQQGVVIIKTPKQRQISPSILRLEARIDFKSGTLVLATSGDNNAVRS